MATLLLRDTDVAAPVVTALREGRLDDAGRHLMEEYDLSCEEVGELLDLDCPAGQ